MQPGLNGYRSRLQFSLTDAKDLDLGCQQCMEFMLTPSGRITIGPYHSAVDYQTLVKMQWLIIGHKDTRKC